MNDERSYIEEPTIDREPSSAWVPAIKVLSGPLTGTCTEIKGSSFTIGRSKNNGLRLEDEAVSRRHAAIEEKDTRFIIHDLGSRWGIKINGQKVKDAPLNFGDEIEIAGIRLSFNLELKNTLTPAKNGNRTKIVICVLIFIAVLCVASLVYFKHKTVSQLDRPAGDTLSQIMYHYDRGIQLYNSLNVTKNSDMSEVIIEMKKVIELDTEGKTQFSRSARRIIDGLEK